MNGLKSISHELQMQLPHGIDHVFCQAGGGGLALGVAQGFLDIEMSLATFSLPKVHIVQPEGNDTMASALRFPNDSPGAVDCWTRISGLQVASVVDGHEAVEVCRKTEGTGFLVIDDTVWECQRTLAETEGVFCEPAAAVSVMGAITAFQMGQIKADDIVVCPITGSGFKDPASVIRMNENRDCPSLSREKFQQLFGQ
jgi:threonine synthase